MSSKKVLELRQSILKHNTELSKLKDELETSILANERYNKILIQKAMCKKELDNALNKSFFSALFKKFANRNEKLICDYFKS